MILGFKQQFIEPIINRIKIHTIREDKNDRWKANRIINAATGVRTKNYNQFAEMVCHSTQKINIYPERKAIEIYNDPETIDWLGNFLSPSQIEILSENDGFEDVEDFWKWFDKPFRGKIIHWTELKY